MNRGLFTLPTPEFVPSFSIAEFVIEIDAHRARNSGGDPVVGGNIERQGIVVRYQDPLVRDVISKQIDTPRASLGTDLSIDYVIGRQRTELIMTRVDVLIVDAGEQRHSSANCAPVVDCRGSRERRDVLQLLSPNRAGGRVIRGEGGVRITAAQGHRDLIGNARLYFQLSAVDVGITRIFRKIEAAAERDGLLNTVPIFTIN